MATVYSLVVWGGLTGKAVTASSTTDLLTLTNHGLRNFFGVFFSLGTLPTVSGTALALNTLYYTKPIAANTFELYYDQALTSKIDFTSNGSSLILKSGYLLGLDLSRWGGTRVYAGFDLANSARSAVITTDDEVIESAEAFDEYISGGSNLGSGNAASYTFTTTINGVRSAAFHNGVVGAGHVITATSATGVFYTSQINVTVDGFEFVRNSSNSSTTNRVVHLQYGGNVFKNNIVRNLNDAGLCHGIIASGAGVRVYNNIVVGICPGATTVGGIAVYAGAVVYNNTVTKCGVGIIGYSGGGTYAECYNNLCVGNDLNYGGQAVFSASRYGGNIGEIDDKITFTVTSGTKNVTLSSAPASLFVNQQLFLKTTGTLPAVGGTPLLTTRSYFVVSIVGTTIQLATTYNSSGVTFSDVGTGTHVLDLVWSNTVIPSNHIDFTTPNNVFVDWTNNDFRPAGYGTSSPGSEARMIDAAIAFSSAPLLSDVLGKERPMYRNGAAEYSDVGAFEMDFGYGPRPATHTLTLTNVVVGSRVHIRDQADTVTHYDQVAAASTVVIPITVYSDSRDNWRIKVRKASAAPYYQPWETIMTATAGSSSIYVSQIPD